MPKPTPLLEPEMIAAFPEAARRAVYECIAWRRDIRHFRANLPVDDGILQRILGAAHAAPSVGFCQPWGFVVVRDPAIRARIRDSFLKCREAEAIRFPSARRDAYLAHKLEGICESALNLCVAVDLRDRDEAILGTTVQPEAVRASACCAVENLWLAARAEGIGVGWVSIVEPAVLRHELALPPGVEPIAYLCIGHPIAFRRRPMLEETGWRPRAALSDAVHWHDRWRAPAASAKPQKTPGISDGADLPEPKSIAPVSIAAREAARAHQATLTKPAGSLGRLEELAIGYAAAHGVFPPPALERAALALFAADHGVVAEGVSAYGSQVTAAMVANVMAGGAAINAIANDCRVDILLTDVGVAGDLSALPREPLVALRGRKLRAGTGNFCREPAMTRAEAEAALRAGAEVARAAVAENARAIALGEIGIGNTTAAAAICCVFTGVLPERAVGRGTGIDDATLARKAQIVAAALARHRPDARDALGALAAVGGLEIAALAGCAIEAARLRLPIVLDGFVTNIAALVALALEPEVAGYLFAAHLSTEPGARLALAHLGLQPLLDLNLRLGEGTGACLGVALLRSAVQTQRSMATFATAGIVGRSGIQGAHGR